MAKVRALNRVLCIGETFRATLNSLATVAPAWLHSFAPEEWHARYDHRIEENRLPQEITKRTTAAEIIGTDGYQLLTAIDTTPALNWLHHVPAVQILPQVWLQQFEMVDGQVHFRSNDNIPPKAPMICSPYDSEATYGRKQAAWWIGYKVHLTESCDEDQPRLITHVETSLAGKGDVDVTPVIHRALKDKELLPKDHLTDTNYAESKQFVASQVDYGIDLIAPTRSDNKWQGRAKQGFDASSFHLDWQAQEAMCPTGQKSSSWTPALDRRDNEVIKIKFSTKDCQSCSCRSQCTQTDRRSITVRKEEYHVALQKARARQKTPAFRKIYHKRAGIEATMSQGVRAFGMRRSRYDGFAKTHLQHLACATAINIVRVLAWLEYPAVAKTRTSHFAALTL